MPQQPQFAIENNFTQGLITTATGLNFPPNACTETFNCEFGWDGSVTRRLGFDFETAYQTKTIDRANKAINTYLWRNVAGNGDTTLAVLQVGLTIYFFEIIANQSFSSGQVSSTVTLTSVGGTNPEIYDCDFSDGNGLLFITHPFCDPVRVAYDISTHTATGTSISLMIRDLSGSNADPYDIVTRPTSTFVGLNQDHLYNLYNQGWSVSNLTAWDTAQTSMPSNADVMWQFVDSSNNFDASTASINRVTAGNTPAPKGHWIYGLFSQDRNAISGLTTVTNDINPGTVRPATSAFFAGRIFYAGISASGYNSNIYFSQIVENVNQYGYCYQQNDPTAQDLFDLLPTDGGVISLPEAGTIHKMVSIPGGLTVHADNGTWFIAGSSGIGFLATDYTVQKISTFPTLSASSFVIVNGMPVWWNSTGIYSLLPGGNNAPSSSNDIISQGGLPTVKSLTDSTIWAFFQEIPLASKRKARGIYHYNDRHIRWIYKTTDTNDVTAAHEFDAVLNFNTITGAFYPWTVDNSNVTINGIIISDLISGNVSVNNVVDSGSNNIVDSSGNQIIVFETTATNQIPFDKYIVSYKNGGTYNFTFASKINASYIDWFTYDLAGVNFDSFLVTGYKIVGGAIRRAQNNWVRIFTAMDTDDQEYFFQGIWDYAITGAGTGRWSSKQHIIHTDTNYSTVSKRLKIRGHGLVFQYKLSSIDGKPFTIVGWSRLDTVNNLP